MLSGALPNDGDFWDYLISTGSDWRLITYEQDWMEAQFLMVPEFKVHRYTTAIIYLPVPPFSGKLTVESCGCNKCLMELRSMA
jgi:hypothetical protein